MVDPERIRIWAARLAAPLVFFVAATVLVVLVQRALEADAGEAGGPGATTSALDTGPAPTTTEPAEEEPEGRRRFYRVRPGDTLESIAVRFDTSVDELLELNPGIDPLALSPRQRIRVR